MNLLINELKWMCKNSQKSSEMTITFKFIEFEFPANTENIFTNKRHAHTLWLHSCHTNKLLCSKKKNCCWGREFVLIRKSDRVIVSWMIVNLWISLFSNDHLYSHHFKCTNAGHISRVHHKMRGTRCFHKRLNDRMIKNVHGKHLTLFANPSSNTPNLAASLPSVR
jgi:hypothetical protein